MTSVLSTRGSPSVTSVGAPGALYVQINTVPSSFFQTRTGATDTTFVAGFAAIGSGVGEFISSQGIVLRDMGKVQYVPNTGSANYIPNTGVLAQNSSVLRKVQVVPAGADGYYGVGGTDANNYLTTHINFPFHTGNAAGVAAGTPVSFVRLI